MTQEEKKLLQKDICARLPYGVKLGFKDSDLVLEPKEYNIFTGQLFVNQMNTDSNITVGFGYEIHNYLPYLRPMSSMTDEEIDSMWQIYENDAAAEGAARITDFLNERHLDHHHLIENGLALEAKEGMYKTE